MARKTKGSAARRPPQPARRPSAAAEPDSGEDLEQRLAALEQERQELLERARAAGVLDDAPEAEDGASDVEEPEGTAGEAVADAPEVVPPATRRRVGAATATRGTAARHGSAPAVAAEPASRPSPARRVGRVTAPSAGERPRAAAGRSNIPSPTAADSLDPADAAIPLERVPYVGADLRRVGVIAALMVVLIVIADIVVRVVVK